MSRFAKTYCSQCGQELGPGDEGVSHCSDHRSVMVDAATSIRNKLPMGWNVAVELAKKVPLSKFEQRLSNAVILKVDGMLTSGVKEFCRFPNCKRPMDPGPEPWCARGLPHG